jgi:hypothetical protein
MDSGNPEIKGHAPLFHFLLFGERTEFQKHHNIRHCKRGVLHLLCTWDTPECASGGGVVQRFFDVVGEPRAIFWRPEFFATLDAMVY